VGLKLKMRKNILFLTNVVVMVAQQEILLFYWEQSQQTHMTIERKPGYAAVNSVTSGTYNA